MLASFTALLLTTSEVLNNHHKGPSNVEILDNTTTYIADLAVRNDFLNVRYSEGFGL